MKRRTERVKKWMKWRWTFRLWLARRGLWLPGKVMYIGGSDVLPAPLSREEEGICIARLEAGEEGAANRLIEHNLRLVVYIARRFENTGVGIEDLISIGTIGLIKGITTFDASKGARLATYAARCVENEILMHFRSQRKSAQDVSLSDYIETGTDGAALSLMDVGSEDSDLLEQVALQESVVQLRKAIKNCLTDQERLIIRLRYGMDGERPHRQREVAAVTGISRSYVSRIEKRALEKLRKALEA